MFTEYLKERKRVKWAPIGYRGDWKWSAPSLQPTPLFVASRERKREKEGEQRVRNRIRGRKRGRDRRRQVQIKNRVKRRHRE